MAGFFCVFCSKGINWGGNRYYFLNNLNSFFSVSLTRLGFQPNDFFHIRQFDLAFFPPLTSAFRAHTYKTILLSPRLNEWV